MRQDPEPTGEADSRVANRSGTCPLCGEPFGDREVDRDHVFGRAFGGRKTVVTHKECNSRAGHGAEGRLHRPNTLLSFIRSGRGLPAPELRGVTDSGRHIDVDLPRGNSSYRRPNVAVSRDGDSVQLSAAGAEVHVRDVLKDWRKRFGDAVPTWENLPPGARKELVDAPEDVRMSLTHDLKDSRTFAVKVALEAGVVAFGDDFASSDFASALRARGEWTPDDAGVSPGLLEATDTAQAALAAEMVGGGLDSPVLPSLADGSGASDVTFVPHGQHTVVFVRILGFCLDLGLIVQGTLPPGDFGLRAAPVLVREDQGDVEVVDFTELLLRPVLDQAVADAKATHDESD